MRKQVVSVWLLLLCGGVASAQDFEEWEAYGDYPPTETEPDTEPQPETTTETEQGNIAGVVGFARIEAAIWFCLGCWVYSFVVTKASRSNYLGAVAVFAACVSGASGAHAQQSYIVGGHQIRANGNLTIGSGNRYFTQDNVGHAWALQTQEWGQSDGVSDVINLPTDQAFDVYCLYASGQGTQPASPAKLRFFAGSTEIVSWSFPWLGSFVASASNGGVTNHHGDSITGWAPVIHNFLPPENFKLGASSPFVPGVAGSGPHIDAVLFYPAGVALNSPPSGGGGGSSDPGGDGSSDPSGGGSSDPSGGGSSDPSGGGSSDPSGGGGGSSDPSGGGGGSSDSSGGGGGPIYTISSHAVEFWRPSNPTHAVVFSGVASVPAIVSVDGVSQLVDGSFSFLVPLRQTASVYALSFAQPTAALNSAGWCADVVNVQVEQGVEDAPPEPEPAKYWIDWNGPDVVVERVAPAAPPGADDEFRWLAKFEGQAYAANPGDELEIRGRLRREPGTYELRWEEKPPAIAAANWQPEIISEDIEVDESSHVTVRNGDMTDGNGDAPSWRIEQYNSPSTSTFDYDTNVHIFVLTPEPRPEEQTRGWVAVDIDQQLSIGGASYSPYRARFWRHGRSNEARFQIPTVANAQLRIRLVYDRAGRFGSNWSDGQLPETGSWLDMGQPNNRQIEATEIGATWARIAVRGMGYVVDPNVVNDGSNQVLVPRDVEIQQWTAGGGRVGEWVTIFQGSVVSWNQNETLYPAAVRVVEVEPGRELRWRVRQQQFDNAWPDEWIESETEHSNPIFLGDEFLAGGDIVTQGMSALGQTEINTRNMSLQLDLIGQTLNRTYLSSSQQRDLMQIQAFSLHELLRIMRGGDALNSYGIDTDEDGQVDALDIAPRDASVQTPTAATAIEQADVADSAGVDSLNFLTDEDGNPVWDLGEQNLEDPDDDGEQPEGVAPLEWELGSDFEEAIGWDSANRPILRMSLTPDVTWGDYEDDGELVRVALRLAETLGLMLGFVSAVFRLFSKGLAT